MLSYYLGSELNTFADCVDSKVFHCPNKSLNFPFNWKDYSIGIVSSFSLFIPPRIIDEIPLINIHPSLLPEWRGPAPIQYTLLHGQDRTGVSIIDLHPKVIDAGSILLQEPFTIPHSDCIEYTALESQLAEIGGRLAATVVSNFASFNSSKRIQDGEVTHSRKISKSDGVISFKTDSFDQISRKVRALGHQIPIKTLDLIEGKQVILEDILLLGSDYKANQSGPFYDKCKGAVIFSFPSKFIGVGKFKIEGKSQIFPAGSFYSNYLRSGQ